MKKCCKTCIFDSVHTQLARENSKFHYSSIKVGARSKDYEVSLLWLESARIVLKCRLATEGKYPVNLYEVLDNFKLYYSDVGLLSMKMGINSTALIQNLNVSDKANGILAENYVAQELNAAGKKLNYWSSGNSAEVDFVFQADSVQSAIPLEVKFADNVRAKSLKKFILLYSPAFSIRVSARNFGLENDIKSIPLYALFTIKDDN